VTDVRENNRFPTTGQAPRIPDTYTKRAEAEGFAVARSAHATAARVFPMARAYIFTSEGAQVVPSSTGPSWRPGEPIPRAGEAEPNALRALFRAGEEHGRHVAEEGRRKARAA
jgi:hypothetical protein